ncbi:hypothetical protein L21_0127 [Methanoculleus chikugoensis]|uniref:Archaeal Type IV pilin N-terminal domain-containing protein n=2 Tax=Methanoculleus chikugoensis TaxID=118126 RepID=A0A1M4MH68_9EURY|nr:hypothetical protein L21_0127 [Methanoculleus chikugoensis]
MLMLVVTIIIAAVVSAFAGGLTETQKAAPQLTMDVAIVNTGHSGSSYILFDVKGTSEPIPTKDLKIATSWTKASGEMGGGVCTVGEWNTNVAIPGHEEHGFKYNSPIGFGKGVQGKQGINTTTYGTGQYFANYTLVAGTTMKSSPAAYEMSGYGATDSYKYAVGEYWKETNIDGMMAILGKEWSKLRAGDTVDVRVTHIPSGKVIFTKTVGVQG